MAKSHFSGKHKPQLFLPFNETRDLLLMCMELLQESFSSQEELDELKKRNKQLHLEVKKCDQDLLSIQHGKDKVINNLLHRTIELEDSLHHFEKIVQIESLPTTQRESEALNNLHLKVLQKFTSMYQTSKPGKHNPSTTTTSRCTQTSGTVGLREEIRRQPPNNNHNNNSFDNNLSHAYCTEELSTALRAEEQQSHDLEGVINDIYRRYDVLEHQVKNLKVALETLEAKIQRDYFPK